MNRMELLLHELEITTETEDWYPPLHVALEGVTAAQASWRPQGEAANTIWETANHLLFYKERLLKQLTVGYTDPQGMTNDDTFAVDAAPDDEAAWQATRERLVAVQRELHALLSSMPEEAFDRPHPTRPLGLMVTSIVLHDACHTGQIVMIRKLQGSWPARRAFE
ncbi:DinB family protein [Brevibacillus fluminis]|uniref:DinB family protein n=1 Tax=Brevibacillus fluminis TaxID=511487 RepID=UPI003F8AE893